MDLMLIDLLESSKAIGLCPMGNQKYGGFQFHKANIPAINRLPDLPCMMMTKSYNIYTFNVLNKLYLCFGTMPISRRTNHSQ